MTIYYAGTSLADLSGYAACVVDTSSSNASTAVCREGIKFTGTASLYIDLPSGVSDCWFSARMKTIGTTGGALTFIEFYDTTVSNTQALFRFTKSGNFNAANACTFEYWNGSAWTSVGSFTTGTSITNITARMNIADSGGTAQAWYGGANIGSLTGDTKFTASTTINRIKMTGGGAAASNDWTISEMVVADTDTRDFRVAALAPTGNGTNTAWTNDYLNVDETGLDDTDYISGASNGDIETYTAGDIDSSLSTADVAAVVVATRSRRGGTGPQNLQGVVRTNSTNYASSSISNLSTAFGPAQAIWMTNPDTGSAWTYAQVNGLEIGVKAVT